jgi:hypothetical protein
MAHALPARGVSARSRRRVAVASARSGESGGARPAVPHRAPALPELARSSPDARGSTSSFASAPSLPAVTPATGAGCALVGAAALFFAARAKRAASRRERDELRREIRGDLIRRRLANVRADADAARAEDARLFRDAAMMASTSPVTLGVTCEVPSRGDGEVWITGAADALGAWDLRRARALTRLGRDRWQIALRAPHGPLEYRYALVTVDPRTGERVIETETGPARSRVVVSDADAAQLFVDDVAPTFATFAPAAAPAENAEASSSAASAYVDAAAARRVVARHGVALDVALELLASHANDEARVDAILVAARGPRGGGGERKPRGFERRPSAFVSDVDVTARLRGAGARGDARGEVYVSDDVKVVEDFTEVSDDDLAALVDDLRRELDAGGGDAAKGSR